MKEIDLVVKACEDKIAKDVVTLKLDGGLAIADYFVVATGNTANQTQAISDEVQKVAAENHMDIVGVEGYSEGSWILVDLGDIVVHVFTPESREYYSLERLWT
ncbi:ribosome silencing factor [Lagierella sp.]|uniref:ribosome silencing factor n=1 Tax=Lagierella sp. TaxID=2849657 RepID=UPI002625BFA2|nr:ribosome silencing factor [Lagierella sp.]